MGKARQEEHWQLQHLGLGFSWAMTVIGWAETCHFSSCMVLSVFSLSMVCSASSNDHGQQSPQAISSLLRCEARLGCSEPTIADLDALRERLYALLSNCTSRESA